MLKLAETALFAPQRPSGRSAGKPFADTHRLARGLIHRYPTLTGKDCEFFSALHAAQSILNASSHSSPFICVRGGVKIETNGRFNLMFEKHAPLLSRHGLLKGITLSLEPGSRSENCGKLHLNVNAAIKRKSAKTLLAFASEKNPSPLLSFIAGGLQAINDLRFKAAFLEFYAVASEGAFNGIRAKIQESAEMLWKAAQDAGLIKYPIT